MAVKATDMMYNFSPELQDVVGAGPMTRGAATKALWVYIKANNLQDPNDGRQVNSDDKLRKIFAGKDQVNMFEIAKLLSTHLIKTDEAAPAAEMPMAA